MTLLITVIAAVVTSILWYTKPESKMRLGTLSLMFWGASLMWFMDFCFEYAELHAEYFNQEFADILNDSILGLTTAVLGIVVWIVILIVKDPMKIFKKAK